MASSTACHLAIDLGASTGRVIAGKVCAERLAIHEVCRFAHAARKKDGHLRWDAAALLDGVRRGLNAAAKRYDTIASVSCDSWSQDFGLLDRDGNLLADPISYRDDQAAGLPDAFSHTITPTELLKRTGSTASPITTLCQLYAMTRRDDPVLREARHLLHMADLVHHMLCGAVCTDWTMATAGQMRNITNGTWDTTLLEALGINPALLPPIVDAPAVIGTIAKAAGVHATLAGVPVVSGAHHDTAAATAAVMPLSNDEFFFSAGTYGMLGALIDTPVLPQHNTTDFALLGVARRRWSLWTMVPGLWALQQCVAAWSRNGNDVSHDTLEHDIADTAIDSVVDLNDPTFIFANADMPGAIAAACAGSKQRVPTTRGEFGRVIVNSLAQNVAVGIKRLEQATGHPCRGLRMVSGGSRSAALCRQIAQTVGIDVLAGPTEAAAVGNLLTQAVVMHTINEMDHCDHACRPMVYKAEP